MQDENRTTFLKYILKEGFGEDINGELNKNKEWEEKLNLILGRYKQ